MKNASIILSCCNSTIFIYASFFDACFHDLLLEIYSCHIIMILSYTEEPSHNDGFVIVRDPCDSFLLEDCFYNNMMPHISCEVLDGPNPSILAR